MKKLLFLIGLLGSTAHAGIRVDSLNVTTSSITINGTNYIWNAGAGSAGQCLITNGGTPPTLTFGSCGSGSSGNRFILLEDGIPAPPVVPVYVLLEGGLNLLLEGNDRMVLEKP